MLRIEEIQFKPDCIIYSPKIGSDGYIDGYVDYNSITLIYQLAKYINQWMKEIGEVFFYF